MVAPSAGATIANAGDTTVSLQMSLFTSTFTVAGMSSVGTGAATIRDNGLVNVPQSSIEFQPVQVQMNLPDDPSSTSTTGSSPASTSPAVVTVQAVAMSDFNGGIDPNTGSAFLLGSVELLWSEPPNMNNCPVGPFRFVARSNAQGAIPYSVATGSASLVDPGFTVGAIPSSTAGCGGYESAINDALSLPVTTTTTTTLPGMPAAPTTTDPTAPPPVPAVVLSLSFSPAPRAAAPVPPARHPHPTTTVTPTTASLGPPNFGPPPVVETVGPPRSGGTHRTVHRSTSHKVNHKKVSKKKRHPKPKTSTAVRRVASGQPAQYLGGGRLGTPRPRAKKAKRATGSESVSFVPASFVKRSSSALTNGLDLAGLLGLLVFSSLALWLVTSEIADIKAGARRQRSHRIAGITGHR